ncbi:hypothetical protein M426DRAFT_14295 [Hypoxylon sp. CI-4A]|nr:hypothetical protein M426DRAFT_14295 [Hypoxylon sp. CI-4A]
MISLPRLLPLFLLYPTFSTATPGFIAHKEKNCAFPLDIMSDGEPVPENKLLINHSITEWSSHAGGHFYENLTFPAAPPSGEDNDVGTNYVYWKAEQPDPGCQYILMKDTPRGWQVLNKLPGDEILRVQEDGCYYTALNPNDNLITSYCCGRDDCALAEIEIQHDQPKEIGNEDVAPPNCKVKQTYSATPTIQDGVQIAVTRPQTCEASPACSHSISEGHMVQTAVSTFQSFTWTTDEGVDVGVEAGVDFITEAKAKVGVSFNIAQSWMQETGTTFTQSNVTTTQEAARQVDGTIAFYSFTPQYECWKGDVTCGNDINGNEVILTSINFCQPRISTTGEAAGIFRMVYISD